LRGPCYQSYEIPLKNDKSFAFCPLVFYLPYTRRTRLANPMIVLIRSSYIYFHLVLQ
jgi:hypothetical protein